MPQTLDTTDPDGSGSPDSGRTGLVSPFFERMQVGGADMVFAAALVAAVALVASMVLVAAPLGDYLLPSGGFHFFLGAEVYRKPAEQMRYLLAIAFVLGFGLIVALVRLSSALTETRARRVGIRLASVVGQFAIVAVAVWSWRAQFHWPDGEPPTVHFAGSDLITAVVVAGVLGLLVRLRPHWLDPRSLVARRSERWVWFAVAALLTVCWLLPSVFREQNLAPAGRELTYHLQFTFDDCVALVNGRTPLVNYAAQYASLFPFIVWPVFRLAGTQIGTFTVMMCFLSMVGLLAVQRVFALVTRSERLAVALYVPFLATSLFFILRSGSHLFSWANYYAVFPMRYVGPYVLLWLCIRHLRGMRPRSPIAIFAFSGLVVLNNVEFGLPAFVGVVAAFMVAGKPGSGRVMRLLKDGALGFAGALMAVSTLTLLLAGQLPNLGLLTLYSRLFGEGGYGLMHTPVAGLYILIDMTFAAAILVAAVRYRRGAIDTAYTAALAYSGVFGLGAGNYYIGRTHPAGLTVLFSVWALSVALLALLALRALAAWHRDSRAPSPLLLAGALISLGLISTTVGQFPIPWTQLNRIAASAPPPAPYNISAAVALLRRTARRGEPVMVFAPLGHLVALDAAVENVSPYSHPDGILTYQQMNEVLTALHDAGGTRFYVADSTLPNSTFPGAHATFPEILRILASKGFTPVMTDPASGITEWRLKAEGRDPSFRGSRILALSR